jgi:hypothetical protein
VGTKHDRATQPATDSPDPVSQGMSTVDAYAGDFVLAIPVQGRFPGTLVQVAVSALHPSRLTLDFGDAHQVLTDACVLLCGHTGALKLLELGYTGPLARRPHLAGRVDELGPR